MAEIIIIPTSHIAEESLRTVERVITREKPDCVAVELDLNRFIVMEGGESSNWHALRNLGPWTFAMFFLMKKVQNCHIALSWAKKNGWVRLEKGKLLHTLKVKAAGNFGEHGRASARVNNGGLILFGRTELKWAIKK